MCMGPDSPPPPPPPVPAQAPPPLAILKGVTDDTSRTSAALSASRGRNALRIDKTQNAPGAAGSGLNIPT